MVEHAAVNRRVAGSSPACGAKGFKFAEALFNELEQRCLLIFINKVTERSVLKLSYSFN